MNPIEELLKKERERAPTLSGSTKDRLFARVLEKEEALHMPSWQERMRTWFVIPALSVGALGVAVFALWYVAIRVENQNAQIAQGNQPATENINIQQQNINTEQSNTNSVPEQSVIAHVHSINEYVFGVGGAAPSHHWTLNTALHLSEVSTPTVLTGVLPTLSIDEVPELASLVGVEMSALHMRKTGLGDTIYTTQPATAQSSLCLETRILKGLTGRCVFISTRGVVDIEQSENKASGEGLTEAFSYITQLTSLSQDEWEVVPLHIVAQSPYMEGWEQYYITPRNTSVFLGHAWHASLSNGKLVSLLGSFVNPKSDTIPADVISPAEAFARVQADFDQTTTASGVSEERWVVGSYADPFGDVELSARASVSIDVLSVTLTTALFETPATSGRGAINTFPVYTVRGVEHGTQNEFQAVVDASASGVLNARHYRLMTHPAQLIGM